MTAETRVRRTQTSLRVIGKAISIEAVKPGMHEVAEGIACDTVWRISPDRSSGSLMGLLRIFRGSGVYVKLPVDGMNLPENAVQQMQEGSGADEAVIFLSTRMGYSSVEVMVALRYSEQWREIARWRSRWTELGVSRTEICRF